MIENPKLNRSIPLVYHLLHRKKSYLLDEEVSLFCQRDLYSKPAWLAIIKSYFFYLSWLSVFFSWLPSPTPPRSSQSAASNAPRLDLRFLLLDKNHYMMYFISKNRVFGLSQSVVLQVAYNLKKGHTSAICCILAYFWACQLWNCSWTAVTLLSHSRLYLDFFLIAFSWTGQTSRLYKAIINTQISYLISNFSDFCHNVTTGWLFYRVAMTSNVLTRITPRKFWQFLIWKMDYDWLALKLIQK